jgi:MoxR-like ATPase
VRVFPRTDRGYAPLRMSTLHRPLAIVDGQLAAPGSPDAERRHAALAAAGDVARRLVENVETVVRGKRPEVELVVAAVACDGHVLIEDVPGTAKTVLARALAQSVEGAVASRIQCTPDLQPSDVTGMSVFDQRTREFEFRPGPVFANVLLADEVNRALPKTQSALLEAMAERQVTVDGETRRLPRPFLLVATENPVELEGTFPLPEAQLDRFLVRLSLGYPLNDDEELLIVQQQRRGHPLASCRAVVTLDDVRILQEAVPEIYVDELLQRWIVRLVRATRELDLVELSASVRGSIALERMARAWALLQGREYVEPTDVEYLFEPVIGHRLLFAPGFGVVGHRLRRADAVRQVWERCLDAAPPPSLER